MAERPALHFTPPAGWLNDPNGLVFYKGEYHLFYQYYPHSLVWGPMHWGHAVSRDLLQWEHLDPALTPDESGQCFSGSAVVDWENTSGLFPGEPGLVAFFTSVSPAREGAPGVQSQSIAFSRDKGRSWQHYPGNPVLANPGILDFRDPKVFWHTPTRRWVMALACDQCVRFYTSPNLLDWQYASEFGADSGAHDSRSWECPDLFEMSVAGSEQKHWVLVVGIQEQSYSGGSGTQYFVGQFDGERFSNDNPPETVLWLDYGRDYYATQSWSDIPAEDGRRLAISWMGNWLYSQQSPATDYRGAMTLPRELLLVDTPAGLRLKQRFVAELGGLQGSVEIGASEPRRLQAGDEQVLQSSRATSHGRLELTLTAGSLVQLYLDQDGYPDLTLTHDGARLLLENRREGSNGVAQYDQHFPHQIGLDLGPSELVELHWLIDRGSLEILMNDGLYSLTNLMFPAPDAGPARLLAGRGVVLLRSLDARSLPMRTSNGGD